MIDKQQMTKGFTLLELAVVLVIIALITSMAMTSGVAMVGAARLSATQAKMAAIDKALLAYRITNNRLPCPASLTIAEGSANYGVEGATPGTCTGGTPAATYSAASTVNPSQTGVEGAVPVTTLGIANDLMYDGWGRRIRYVVDKGVTASNAFTSIASSCTNLAVTVNDANGNARTAGAVYALVSHGENGHGGYSKKGVISSSNSANSAEQTNCHCTSTAAAGTFTPAYIQKDATLNSTNILDSFDDIVSYKERWQMMTTWEKPASCGYVYVLDYYNCRVQWFDLLGNYVGKHDSPGGCGSGVGQWNQAEVISIDGSGNIYISDDGNSRVLKFSNDWTFKYYLGSTSPDPALPEELAFDLSGNVWGANWGANTIEKFSPTTGTMIATYGSNPTLYGDDSIAINPLTGNAWVCNMYGYNYQEWSTATGTQVGSDYSTYSNIGDKCQSMAFDSKGNIWITDQVGKVYKISASDHSTKLATSPSTGAGAMNFSGASNLRVAVDGSDNVWVTDWANNRVVKFDNNANYLLSVGSSGTGNGQFSGPVSVAITGR